MLSSLLAFRPASVMGRLPPRSDACPLSLKDLLAAGEGLHLPSIEAEGVEVIRAVLVAAKALRAAVGLSLPPGLAPEPWFDAVGRTADELAAGLPYFLSAEVALDGESALLVDRVTREVWRLVSAGLTHLTLDASRVSPEERGRVLAETAGPLLEAGLCFDCAVPLSGREPGTGRRALALVEELQRRGAPVDAVSVRCPAVQDADAARAQVGALDRLAVALRHVPVVRRGPISSQLVAALAHSRVRVCADGGATARAAGAEAAWSQGESAGEGDDRRARWREQAAAALGTGDAGRPEARAFIAAVELIEGLGAEGSAPALARSLEQRRAEDRD